MLSSVNRWSTPNKEDRCPGRTSPAAIKKPRTVPNDKVLSWEKFPKKHEVAAPLPLHPAHKCLGKNLASHFILLSDLWCGLLQLHPALSQPHYLWGANWEVLGLLYNYDWSFSHMSWRVMNWTNLELVICHLVLWTSRTYEFHVKCLIPKWPNFAIFIWTEFPKLWVPFRALFL